MEIPEKLAGKLNEQVRNELNAGYIYLAMSAWFEKRNLPGFARWMMAQYAEEQTHAMKIYRYLLDRGAGVKLLAIPEPRAEYGSCLEAFEAALAHEKSVTAIVAELYELSVKERDAASSVFLQWFVNEQVEEEKTVEDIISSLKLVKEDSAGILMLDRELGQRQ